jgi:hypothetical protein
MAGHFCKGDASLIGLEVADHPHQVVREKADP